jgi:hypothetical protein
MADLYVYDVSVVAHRCQGRDAIRKTAITLTARPWTLRNGRVICRKKHSLSIMYNRIKLTACILAGTRPCREYLAAQHSSTAG